MKASLIRVLSSALLPIALGIIQPASAKDWTFEVAPYLWVAGVDGDISIKTREYNLSADFDDILDQTKFGGSLIFAANRGRWVNFAQIDYLALENDDVQIRRFREEAKLENDSLLLTAATGYRLPVGERHNVDVMIGLRYAGLDIEMKDRLGSTSSNRDIYDGIVMLRPNFRLGDNWTLMPSFSVGTGDSDLTWEVFPEIIYQPGNWKFRIGYRNLNYEHEEGSDEIDFSMRGALLGVGFVF